MKAFLSFNLIVHLTQSTSLWFAQPLILLSFLINWENDQKKNLTSMYMKVKGNLVWPARMSNISHTLHYHTLWKKLFISNTIDEKIPVSVPVANGISFPKVRSLSWVRIICRSSSSALDTFLSALCSATWYRWCSRPRSTPAPSHSSPSALRGQNTLVPENSVSLLPLWYLQWWSMRNKLYLCANIRIKLW